MRTALRIGAAVVLLGIATGSAPADVIDQSYVPVTGQDFNTSDSGNLPLGQSFTPTLGSVDFVKLYIQDAGSDIGPGTSFEVMIRAGTIGGAILGTSNVVSVPDNLNLGIGLFANFTTTRFDFAAPIALTPGQVYVIDIVQLPPIVTGNFNFAAGGGPLNSSAYAGGTAIVNGAALPGFDFAFQEGVHAVPEPASILHCALGFAGLGFALVARRRAAG
jgi:hypothetical protein